jgi:hypothetical protein
MMLWRMLRSMGWALVVGIGACREGDTDAAFDLVRGVHTIAGEGRALVDDLVLEHLYSLPVDDFGVPYAQLATTPGGMLLAHYLDTCTWRVFDLSERREVRSFGGCGGGAQEYGHLYGALGLNDSTVIAYDLRRASFVTIDPRSGVITRRVIPTKLTQDVGASLGALSSLGDTALVTWLYTGSGSGTVAVLNFDGSLLSRHFELLPRSSVGAEALVIPNRGCGVPWPGNEGSIIGINPWRGEVAAISPTGSLRWVVNLGLDWLKPTIPPQGPGSLEPTRNPRGPLCTRRGVLVRYADRDPVRYPRNPDRGGYLEFIDSTGARRLRLEVDTVHNYLLASAATATDSLFFFSDEDADLPQIHVFRLRDRAAGDSSGLRFDSLGGLRQ